MEIDNFFSSKHWLSIGDLVDGITTVFKAKDSLSKKCAEKVIDSVPRSWHNINLRDPMFNNLAGSFINQQWTAKKIYASLLRPDFTERIQAWHKEGLMLSLEQFHSLSAKCTLISNINIRSFFIKFNYKCLTLNYWLSKFSLVSPQCSFCSASNETYSHLFWDCVHTASLWQFIKYKLPTFYHDYIDKQMVLFPLGIPTEVFIVIVLAKHFIYSSSCKSCKPKPQHFKNSLRFHLRCMHYVAKTKSYEQKFLNSWKSIMDSFKISLN